LPSGGYLETIDSSFTIFSDHLRFFGISSGEIIANREFGSALRSNPFQVGYLEIVADGISYNEKSKYMNLMS
jgi:hypothetical protein